MNRTVSHRGRGLHLISFHGRISRHEKEGRVAVIVARANGDVVGGR
jgi:hypothetical protein